MPIQAPQSSTSQSAGEFKETSAAFRKTGPVEKYKPQTAFFKKKLLDGLAPIAPRVEELRKEGKELSVTTIRAAEVAAKLFNKGGIPGNLTPQEVAQAQISIKEALEVGLNDPNSPYYQADTGLRATRAVELRDLEAELDFYLTGGQRELEDYNVDHTDTRWTWHGRRLWNGWGWVPGRLSSTLHSGIELPGRQTTVTTEVRQRPRAEGTPLTNTEIDSAKTQSRVSESWDEARRRISVEKFGKPYAALTPLERRLAAYSASEEVSIKFGDEQVTNLIDSVKKGASEDLIQDAKENGGSAEKILAKRVEAINADQEALLRRSQELYKIKTMGEYQKFLGVNDSIISKTEIAEAIIKHLGITNERQIKSLMAHPDRAYSLLFNREMRLGTVVFTSELFAGKLDKFAEDRIKKEEESHEPRREPGETPTDLSKDALVGLSGEGMAIRLVSGDMGKDPLAYLKDQGIDEATAKKMLSEGGKYVNKRADGVYFINEKTIGSWDAEPLYILLNSKHVDLNDPAKIAELKTQLVESYKESKKGRNKAEREAMADDKIKAVKELAEVTNTSRTEDEQKDDVKKWDKRNLALLSLLLGPLFAARVTGLMGSSDQRAFQNMFG